MNPVHLHLMLNHLPVVGMGFAVCLLAYGIVRRSQELTKAGMGALVIVALLAIPAYLTGEPAEETAERLPGVTEQVIEPHEDAAKVAFALTLAVGALALAVLGVFRGKEPPVAMALGVTALALAAAGTMAWTANLGGKIRHPEIRGGEGSRALQAEGER
jgi:hypothetical protein